MAASGNAVGSGPSDAGSASSGFLVLNGVSKHFGALKAIDKVSFDVKQGQILSVIGPNGAGKTTTKGWRPFARR
jgi:ABC-type uncharacterized transport system ATPase subunit